MKDITTEEAVEMLNKFITEHKFYNIKQSDGLEDNIEKVLSELEIYKRLAEQNLKDSDEFKDNMCEHRCIKNSEILELKDELEKKDKIINAMATTISGISEIRAMMGISNVIASQDEIIKRYERNVVDE